MCRSSHDRVINPWILRFHSRANLDKYFLPQRGQRASQKELRSVVFGADTTAVRSNRWGLWCVYVCFRVTGTRAGYSYVFDLNLQQRECEQI